jgi:hypothetical protein
MAGNIDGTGAKGTNGKPGAKGPDGTIGAAGHDANCSGWFFIKDDPPSRGGNGGPGGKGGRGGDGSNGGAGKTIELHLQVLESGIEIDVSGGVGGDGGDGGKGGTEA